MWTGGRQLLRGHAQTSYMQSQQHVLCCPRKALSGAVIIFPRAWCATDAACPSCLQMQMRRLPKPVIAMVAGYAVGGGHILHMVADITVGTALSPAALSFTAAGQ